MGGGLCLFEFVRVSLRCSSSLSKRAKAGRHAGRKAHVIFFTTSTVTRS